MQAARGLTLSSKNPTFSNSRKVFSEISDAIRGPNGWWHGRSFAASVPSESDSPKSPKGRKEKMKERRAMVEAFVNEYRALNAGNFPNPTFTVKQVGGSYHTVKRIIQELEYNSKQPPTNMTNKGPLVKDVPKGECKSVPKVEEVSSCKTAVDLSLCKPSLRVMDESDTIIINKLDEATSNDFVEKEGPPVSTHVEKPLFEEAVDSTKIGDDSCSITTSSLQIVLENKEVLHMHTELPKDCVEETAKSEGLLDLNCPERKTMHEDGQKTLKSELQGDDSCSITTSSQQIVLENKEVLHMHTELPKDCVEETAKFEGLLDLNCPERKAMHEDGQKTLKSETLERDMSRKETKEEDQLSTRSTLWGNLRSFADGVIKLWRNK